METKLAQESAICMASSYSKRGLRPTSAISAIEGESRTFQEKKENEIKGEYTSMRHYLLLSAVTCLFQMAANAQDTKTISAIGQSIQGTWISQVADGMGNITLFEVGTFSPDGAYTGANVNPSHTTHKGIWVRTGDRTFLLTVMFFTHDDKGVFNAIIKARIYLTISEDLNSYDSVAERVVMDTSGKVLQVVPGIVGHSVRMNLEFPQTPPPDSMTTDLAHRWNRIP